MDSVQNSFNFYRASYEDPSRSQSMEAEGLYDYAAFAAALSDPATVSLTVDTGHDSLQFPLLTPLGHAAWYNLDYQRRNSPTGSMPWLYSHSSQLFASEQHGEAYRATMRRGLAELPRRLGTIVFDYSAAEAAHTESEVQSLAQSAGVQLQTLAGPDGETDVRHYHFSSILGQTGAIDHHFESALPLHTAYQAGLQDGSIPASNTEVTTVVDDADISDIWRYYEPVFDQLSEDDPVQAGFSYDEFQGIMKSPDCVKYMYRDLGKIINVCLLQDVRICEWMNQAFYQRRYPEAYASGRVFCLPGVIADPASGKLSTSLHTMGAVGRSVASSGGSIVTSFACDATSVKYVPRLSQRSIDRLGMTVDFSTPLAEHVFRSYSVSV